jgi:hypothetical protein
MVSLGIISPAKRRSVYLLAKSFRVGFSETSIRHCRKPRFQGGVIVQDRASLPILALVYL